MCVTLNGGFSHLPMICPIIGSIDLCQLGVALNGLDQIFGLVMLGYVRSIYVQPMVIFEYLQVCH